uniref:SEA domain-containing protein n=1 Tax=Xenopus tropicalis TaxID=8364 RepID=A0A1B8Y6V2_XENTR
MDSGAKNPLNPVERTLLFLEVYEHKCSTTTLDMSVSGPTTSKPESEPTTSKPESGPTTSKPESGPTTSKPESGPTTSKPESGPTTSKPESEPTTSKPESEPTTSKPESEPTTSKPESEPTTSKPESEPTTSKPESEQTTSKPESEQTTSKPESEQTTSKPESEQTTSKPGSTQTTVMPGPEQTALSTSNVIIMSTLTTTATTTTPTTTTTTTTTQPTTTKNPFVPPRECLNGGTFDGTRCHSTSNFYGPSCEFADDRVEGPTTSKPGSTQTTVMPGPEQTALSTSDVIIMSTLTTTATTTTPTTTTTTTQPTTTKNPFVTPRECQNGGTFDGTRCHCTSIFYGPSCEFADDRVEVGNKINATVQVNMKITNKQFDSRMENNSSSTFKEFEEEFKAQMKSIYSNVHNYKDVIIRSLSAGSSVVDYEIILEMEYNLEVNVTESYKEIVKIVQEELLSRVTVNSDENSFCFQNLKITTVPVPTYVELCRASIEPGYRDFYTAIITPHGLLCVSHCNEESPQYHFCNSGDCKLEKTGPECLCPKTDIYLYTTSRCKGRILKAGLYGGVGAGMAVLAIIILTLGILLCKAKQPRKR